MVERWTKLSDSQLKVGSLPAGMKTTLPCRTSCEMESMVMTPFPAVTK